MNTRGRFGGAASRLGALLRPGLPRNHTAWRKRLPFTDLAVLILSLVCSAVLLGIAVCSRNYPWVGWVGLTPLFLVIRSLTPFRAMSCGALWGFCLFTLLVSGNGVAATPLDSSFAFLILIPAIYAFIGAHLTRRVGFSPLFLAFGWVGVELALRPLGLSSGLLAGSQGDAGIIQQVGTPLGYFFVAFLIAFVNAKLLSIVNNARFRISRWDQQLYSAELRTWLSLQSSSCVTVFTTGLHRSRGPPFNNDAI